MLRHYDIIWVFWAVCIFVQLNWLPFLNDERVNDSCADEPTLSNITSRPALIRSGIKLLMNQLSHRMPLFKPMILIVSFSRASFSYTTPLIMMATEYIHARVMKRGIDRLITRRKLGGMGGGGTIRVITQASTLMWSSAFKKWLTCHRRSRGRASAECTRRSSLWCR